ncbi:MAG: M28 family peptidase, partial [Victivallales bacterium]|nr:M28 family peptidase [Victivallales bacterium]
IDGAWKEFPCSLFSSAPGTNGKDVEAEIVFFDTATAYKRPDLSYLNGKAVIHLGCHIESEDAYRRLMEAKPAFLLFVDTRYPADIQLADGLFPAYVKKFGAVPSLNVAYQHAWKWKTNGATKARINVVSEMCPAMTTVVVADLPGTDPQGGVIYAGGHHDTQAGTVGADDNAIGSASVVELVRLLSEKPHKRTFRLMSFGAEEQLSLGSASYIRRHRAEIEKEGLFMCNFDSCGSAMGWASFIVNGQTALCDLIRKTLNEDDIYYNEYHGCDPYTDQFPFAACGVPGMLFFRKNCSAGLFFHHRVDNTPDKLDFNVAADYVTGAAKVMESLADADDISPYRGIPADLKVEIDDLFNKVYGGF